MADIPKSNGNMVKFPLWFVRIVFGACLLALFAWVGSLQAQRVQDEARFTRLETHYLHIQQDVAAIRDVQRQILEAVSR